MLLVLVLLADYVVDDVTHLRRMERSYISPRRLFQLDRRRRGRRGDRLGDVPVHVDAVRRRCR